MSTGNRATRLKLLYVYQVGDGEGQVNVEVRRMMVGWQVKRADEMNKKKWGGHKGNAANFSCTATTGHVFNVCPGDAY